MALDGVPVKIREYEQMPDNIPVGEIAFIKSDRKLIVNHGAGIIEYGAPEPLYKGPGVIRQSKTALSQHSKNIATVGFIAFDGQAIHVNSFRQMWSRNIYINLDIDGTRTPDLSYVALTGTVDSTQSDASLWANSPYLYGAIKDWDNRVIPGAYLDVYNEFKVDEPYRGYTTRTASSSAPIEKGIGVFRQISPKHESMLFRVYMTGPVRYGARLYSSATTGSLIKMDAPDLNTGSDRLYCGCVPVPGGGLVLPPFNAWAVGRVEDEYGTNPDRFKQYTDAILPASMIKTAEPMNFVGGAYLPNGWVLFAPYDHTHLGLYNPVTREYKDGPEHHMGPGKRAFAGVCVLPSGLAVLVPRNSMEIGLYDYVTNKFHLGPIIPGPRPEQAFLEPEVPVGQGVTIHNTVLMCPSRTFCTLPGNLPRRFTLYYPADHPYPMGNPW